MGTVKCEVWNVECEVWSAGRKLWCVKFLRRSPRSKIFHLKTDVSCEASVNFQHISRNATPATEFAPCHYLMQPGKAIRKKRATRHV